MVMDATQPQQPSPQSVGREFVRQYYTLLNKAPNHLHRFYNNNSSFIHGESILVVGQKNIHNRIQQLNFHDCHAKISQVDAQATLGNGVVVQVTGELSNDGQPMRRFTQTFVLAAQSPKKYYVHNDIFRYQDLYSDEENDGESRSENDEDHEQTTPTAIIDQQTQVSIAVVADQQQQQVQLQPQQPPLPSQIVASASSALQQPGQTSGPQQAIYYSLPAAGGRPVSVLAAAQGAVSLGTPFAATGSGNVQAQQVQSVNAVTQLNGNGAHEDLLPVIPQTNVAQQPLVPQNATPMVQPATSVPAPVISAQPTTGGIAAVPVASAAGLPQNAATPITGFQQSSLLQQQHQLIQNAPQQQPTMTNTTVSQQALPTQTPPLTSQGVETDEIVSSQTITNSNETSIRSNAALQTMPSAPEPATTPVVDDFKTINEQQQQEKYESTKQQNEPKTYANLFKSTSPSSGGFVNTAMTQPIIQQHTTGATYSSTTVSGGTYSQTTAGPSSISSYSTRNGESSQRVIDNNSSNLNQSAPLPQRVNSRMGKDFEQRRTSNPQQLGDNHQLFLGNIPHHATEEELKALFTRFGVVLELRILSKPGVRNPLNYGFITYEESESVQTCLAHCPLFFPENSPDGVKLNVEEKKPRMRLNDMPPRQSMGNNMNNNMNHSQRNISGGPASRSLSGGGGSGGPGGMMRGNNTSNNNMSRGNAGGPRMGTTFGRTDNRSGGGPSNGPQMRGSNNNSQSGGSSYGGRR